MTVKMAPAAAARDPRSGAFSQFTALMVIALIVFVLAIRLFVHLARRLGRNVVFAILAVPAAFGAFILRSARTWFRAA